MANYIVSDTNLTAVANAIRTKGGTSEQLEFPDDFVSAIGDIQTGGGGTDTLAELESNTLTSWTSTATEVGTYLFYQKTALTSVNYPNATVAGPYCFYNCTNLTTVNAPKLTSLGSSCFYRCGKLVSLDFPVLGSIPTSAFAGSNIFTTLILRKSDSICTLANTNAFKNTPFASGGTGGTLYVPQDLIASYQSADRWSTILGYPNNQIKAIEGSIYE